MPANFDIIAFNKEYIPRTDFSINLTNRAFRYGDGLFESIHANAGKAQFLPNHFKRILAGATILKLQLPDYFTLNYLDSQIAGLLQRCRLYQGARVKISIFRSGAGLFIPESNKADILIEASYLSKGPYELNKAGLIVDVYNGMPKLESPFSSFKSMNALPYILAGIEAGNQNLDDILLISHSGNIVEATSSNFFAVSEKNMYTPALDLGAVDGIMRSQIISIAKKSGFTIYDTAYIKPDDLLKMDELFLTNAVSGIKWIGAFKNKRFVKRTAVNLTRALNDQAFD